MKKTNVILVALLVFLSGCATWQETTRTSLNIAQQIGETGEKAVLSHYQTKCSNLLTLARQANCGEDLNQEVCTQFNKCVSDMQTAQKVFMVLYENIGLALMAITLGDQQSALDYLAKSMDMAKRVYKILKTVLPDKIPDVPFLGE